MIRRPPKPRPFRYGPLLTLIVTIAVLAGIGWIARDRIRDGFRPSSPPSPPPVHVASEPKKSPPLPSKPVSSDSEIAEIGRIVDRLVAEARYVEAEDKLAGIGSKGIQEKLERVRTYSALLRETQRGGTVPMPEMTALVLANGNQLVARTLREDASSYSFEDIRGIRSKVSKADVSETRKLGPHQAFWEVWNELKRLCGYKGIEALDKREPNRYMFTFQERANRKATGLQFFDLADFCVSNGANELLTQLFDEALRRDRDLVRTVHENKGERMVDVLFYFLGVRSLSDAEYTLTQILIPRYSDTRAYRERLSQDGEAKQIVSTMLRRDVPEAGREAAPKVEPPPPRESGAEDPTKVPLPADLPANARKLIEEGDRHFRKGTDHLLKSNPTTTPDGWAGENQKALEEYRQAAGNYASAQESFGTSTLIPRGLLDRFRDAQMRMSLCRKRAVSSR